MERTHLIYPQTPPKEGLSSAHLLRLSFSQHGDEFLFILLLISTECLNHESSTPGVPSFFRRGKVDTNLNNLSSLISRTTPRRVESAEKTEVKVGLVYQSAVHSKKYEKALQRLNEHANGISFNMREFKHLYNFTSVDCHLPKGVFFVNDVIDCICGVMVKEQVAVIIFATTSEDFEESSSSEEFFLQIAASTGIPIIAWNADNSAYSLEKDLSPFRIIQLVPPIEHQIRVMLALLERYNWTRFGVVCAKMGGDEQFGYALRDEMDRMKKRIQFEIIFETIIDATNVTDIDEELAKLKRSQAKVILFCSNNQYANVIMKRGRTIGVVTDNHLWIGTQSVKSTRTGMPSGNLAQGMLAITFNTISDAIISTEEDVIINILLNLPRMIAKAIMTANGTMSFQSTATCEYSIDREPSWHDYQDFSYTFNKYGRLQYSYLEISNLQSPCRDSNANARMEMCWKRVGTYSEKGLHMEDVEWPGGRANPPQMTADKYHLRVVTLHEPPFIVVSDVDPDTGTCPGNRGVALCDWGEGPGGNGSISKCCSGYCVDLLDKLANDMGFEYTLYKVRDEKWGIKTETGWNGLPQDLITGKADMCVTALKLNSERAKDIDFSIPFLDTGIAIIVKIRSGVLSPTAFLEPFEYSMWATILFVCIQGAALFIFVFEWVSPYSFNMQKYPPPDHKFSLCRSYWLVWATLFQASVSTDVPRSFSSRFMALAWAAFGLTFLALYTANLAAFMITRVQFYDLSGINDTRLWYPEDVKPPFRYGTVEGGNTHETMRKNWGRMHHYIHKNRFFKTNISAGVDAVINEELDAFIYDAVVLDYWAGKEANCQLMTVGKWAAMTGYGIGLPKNSPLTPQVNRWMLQYQHNGDLERLQNFWLTGSCTPDGHGQTHSVPLGIENFMSAFFLLAAGIIVSIIVLGCEFFYVKHLREPLKRIDPDGACGLISMAVGRVSEWRKRAESLLPSSPKKLLMRAVSSPARFSPKVSPKRDKSRLYVESAF
ncbi:nmr-2 [Pristionchus pacificus]|uniref:Nmr-2 n=1 Tax=Pristionchus pacificus TaxID=54126 RepID=A0A2A6CSC3_PRIPA|nr:nmr-2 [Pristionchus pacificus]|eukprot:PDM81039.1 nmr-2 [Pristionchus pacificus]